MNYTTEEIEKYIKEIKDLCYSHPDNFSTMLLSTKRKYLYDFLMWFTKELNNKKYKMSTRCYWVLNNIRDWNNELVCCRHCGKPLKHKDAKVFRGYIRPHCNKSCSQADKTVYTKIHQHNIVKYGSVSNIKKGSKTRKQNTYYKLKNNQYMELLETLDEYLKINNANKIHKMRCLTCGNILYQKITKYKKDGKQYLCRCHHCFPSIHNRSHGEIELFNFCKSVCDQNGYTIIPNYKRLISMNNRHLECDIFIDELKLVIEYDGMFYHSEEFYQKYINSYSANRIVYNKITKTKLVEQTGYNIIHIDEYEWINNKEYLKEYLTDLINNKSIFSLNNDIEIVDRQIHCINDKPDGYELIHIIPPQIHNFQNYHVYDCGYLIYRKITPFLLTMHNT